MKHQRKLQMKKGNKVRITEQPIKLIDGVNWTQPMDKYKGLVTSILDEVEPGLFELKVDECLFLWHKSWLELV